MHESNQQEKVGDLKEFDLIRILGLKLGTTIYDYIKELVWNDKSNLLIKL